MNRDDIINMAREVDIDWHRHWNDDESNRLKRFAALVAAAERESCVKMFDGKVGQAYLRDIAAFIRAGGTNHG
jgi:hypothetical protein